MKQPSTVLVTYALPSSACCLQTAINESSAKDVTLTVLVFTVIIHFSAKHGSRSVVSHLRVMKFRGLTPLTEGNSKIEILKIYSF